MTRKVGCSEQAAMEGMQDGEFSNKTFSRYVRYGR